MRYWNLAGLSLKPWLSRWQPTIGQIGGSKLNLKKETSLRLYLKPAQILNWFETCCIRRKIAGFKTKTSKKNAEYENNSMWRHQPLSLLQIDFDFGRVLQGLDGETSSHFLVTQHQTWRAAGKSTNYSWARHSNGKIIYKWRISSYPWSPEASFFMGRPFSFGQIKLNSSEFPPCNWCPTDLKSFWEWPESAKAQVRWRQNADKPTTAFSHSLQFVMLTATDISESQVYVSVAIIFHGILSKYTGYIQIY